MLLILAFLLLEKVNDDFDDLVIDYGFLCVNYFEKNLTAVVIIKQTALTNQN